MDNIAIRQWVKAMYPNNVWAEQVDNMPDYQVYAIYQRHLAYLENQKKEKEKSFEQGSLFEGENYE